MPWYGSLMQPSRFSSSQLGVINYNFKYILMICFHAKVKAAHKLWNFVWFFYSGRDLKTFILRPVPRNYTQ